MTAVANETAYAVIHSCRQHSDKIATLFAGYGGIQGLINEELVDTTIFDEYDLDAMKFTPGGIFGSDRTKIKPFSEDPDIYKRIYEVLKAHNIRTVFFNGGHDAFDNFLNLTILKEKFNYEIILIGIPKTINNDIVCTDFCPGFGSAAK